MMYSDRLVVVIKVDGKVLRESGDVVTLPFNSEYEVFIKNMNSVRAMVKVTVDGVDATEGCKLIVDANDSTSLERFIKNGNFKRGNRFKFIERTSKIEEHRGIGVEDGLIRIEYWFEQLPPRVACNQASPGPVAQWMLITSRPHPRRTLRVRETQSPASR